MRHQREFEFDYGFGFGFDYKYCDFDFLFRLAAYQQWQSSCNADKINDVAQCDDDDDDDDVINCHAHCPIPSYENWLIELLKSILINFQPMATQKVMPP